MVRPSVSSPARRCKADKATRRPGTDTPHPMTFDAVASWAQVGKVALDGHLVGERDLRAVGRAPGAGRERRLELELQVRRRALADRHGADECQRHGVDCADRLVGPDDAVHGRGVRNGHAQRGVGQGAAVLVLRAIPAVSVKRRLVARPRRRGADLRRLAEQPPTADDAHDGKYLK